MDVRVLGPLEAVRADQPVDLGPPKQRLVLCLLICRGGQPMSIDSLVDALWADRPPASARDNVHQHVHRLRKALGPERFLSQGRLGYALQLDRGELDMFRFIDLLATGREAMTASDLVKSARLYRDALSLWRGDPFADLSDEPALAPEIAKLQELRLAALEQRTEADLALGDHAHVVFEMRQLLERYPYRERFHEQLMQALYQTGQKAAALAAFQSARKTFAEDLGLEPGARLRDLENAILNDQPVATAERTPKPTSVGTGYIVPAQLPPAPAAFAGRASELAQLNAAGFAGTGVLTIAGTAGVGKTALAVHWAHQVAERFPDGQLYLNLRGFAAGGPAVEPAEAVRGFLDALAVPPERISSNMDAQCGLYRSLLAGKRVLVLLDNARTAEQVRPLLPGSAGCLAIITSRNQLPSLVALEGTQPINLEVLPAGDAQEILALRLGLDRVSAEADSVDQIVQRCVGLPLALVVIAARAVLQPRLPLALIASELREARDRLDIFAQEDPAADLRTVLSWSYQNLSPEAEELFRLLGAHAGPDISIPAAASLAGVPPRQVRSVLSELTRASMITEAAAGRYSLHDLLRSYAVELSEVHDSADDRAAALGRLTDHYVHTAHAAAVLLEPHRIRVQLDAAAPAVVREQLADHAEAAKWFRAEHHNLLAVVRHTAASSDKRVGQLAWALSDYLQRRGQWQDQALVHRLSLEAAQRLGDRPAQARAHRLLGRALTLLKLYDEAKVQYQNALDLCQEIGDTAGEAHTNSNLSHIAEAEGQPLAGLEFQKRALELFVAAGIKDGQARSLNSIGWFHGLTGDYEAALGCCNQALDMLIELGDLVGQANTIHSIGYAHHQLGQYPEAIVSYKRAVDVFRSLDDRLDEGEMQVYLGDTYLAAGDRDTARDAWRAALKLFEEVGHPKAGSVRTKIESLSLL